MTSEELRMVAGARDNSDHTTRKILDAAHVRLYDDEDEDEEEPEH